MKLRFFLVYVSLASVVFLRIALYSQPEPLPDGTILSGRVRMLSSPQLNTANQRVSVFLEGRKVTLVLPRFAKYQYGDLLEVTGKVETRALSSKRIVSTMYFPHIRVVRESYGWPFQLAGWIRERVRLAFTRFLPPREVSLLRGVVFGIQEGFDQKLKEAFQTTGMMHVVAASGMNVTMLAGFLLPCFSRLVKRQQAVLLTIVFLMFYALLAGLSPSILRATLMASISFIGLLLGRQRSALIALFLTGCIMLSITPSILFDIGFQLSFAATLGILLIQPFFTRLAKQTILKFIASDLGSTLGAQITTLPFLLYYFHAVGLLSVLVNLLVLWTIPPLMVIGSIAAFVSLISSSIGSIIALLTLPLLVYFLSIISFFSSFSPVFSIETVPVSLIVGYYLILGAALAFLNQKKGNFESK